MLLGDSGTILAVPVLLMAGAMWAMIHHRYLAQFLPADRAPVRARPGETVILSSVASSVALAATSLTFVGMGVVMVWGAGNGMDFTLGVRPVSPIFVALMGCAAIGFFGGLLLIFLVRVYRSPDKRGARVRVSAEGVTIEQKRPQLMRWEQITTIEPAPEPKISFIPSYNIRFTYRKTELAPNTVEAQWVGSNIPTDPVTTLNALRAYWLHPELRDDLGTEASITRFVEPSPHAGPTESEHP
nr:hypothetical protein [Rhodococcus qingshengii]